MAKKSTTNFTVGKSLSRVNRPTAFDRIVREVEAKEIPAKYIEQVFVQFHDGSVVEIDRDTITEPVNQDTIWCSKESSKTLKDVKIFIDTAKLEKDINRRVNELLGIFC